MSEPYWGNSAVVHKSTNLPFAWIVPRAAVCPQYANLTITMRAEAQTEDLARRSSGGLEKERPQRVAAGPCLSIEFPFASEDIARHVGIHKQRRGGAAASVGLIHLTAY